MSWRMDEDWHASDDDSEAWQPAGMADAEDWNPDSWRDGWPPTPEELLLRKELEQDEARLRRGG
jgi:hypothetical protein